MVYTTSAHLSTLGSFQPEANASPSTQRSQLLDVAVTILRQAIDLLDHVLTSDEQLTTESKFLPGSTIGKHLRHARDHFVAVLDSISTPPPHVFSFDHRVRDTPMESSRSSAREALEGTVARLEQVVPGAELDTPMTLNAITPYEQTLKTSFGRELWFASLHAIHHWSMVRVMAGELGIELEGDFGFAPSTLLHRSRQGKTKL